jgi:hypothetical protein
VPRNSGLWKLRAENSASRKLREAVRKILTWHSIEEQNQPATTRVMVQPGQILSRVAIATTGGELRRSDRTAHDCNRIGNRPLVQLLMSVCH